MNQRIRQIRFATMLGLLLGLGALACEEDTTAPAENPLQAPTTLQSISLNRAVHLTWSDNPFQANPNRFAWYRVYSTGYDLDAGTCDATWVREGTSVAPEFLVSALQNGVPRCFGVTTISVEGYESAWSPLWQDTPRPDAHNVLIYPVEADVDQAGFRFWDDANGDGIGQAAELGLVQRDDSATVDFRVYRDLTDTLWIEPVFSGTRVQVYGQVEDLTGVDFAPAGGYSRTALQAIPTYAYVFEIVEGASLWYGAVRVSHMGRDYVILDWSFQTDPGNPELVAHGGVATAPEQGAGVGGSR